MDTSASMVMTKATTSMVPMMFTLDLYTKADLTFQKKSQEILMSQDLSKRERLSVLTMTDTLALHLIVYPAPMFILNQITKKHARAREIPSHASVLLIKNNAVPSKLSIEKLVCASSKKTSSAMS